MLCCSATSCAACCGAALRQHKLQTEGQLLQACNSHARLQGTGLSMASCKLPLLQNSRTIQVSKTCRGGSPGEALSSGESYMKEQRQNAVLGEAAQLLFRVAVAMTATALCGQ